VRHIFKKEYSIKILCLKKNAKKQKINKLATQLIAYNMKGCSRFYTFEIAKFG
jgi:hypothetical protein